MIRQSLKRLIKHLSANDYQTLNRIELDHKRVLANITLIQKKHSKQAIIAVLKANAYGHGLVQMATILNDVNCAFMAVDGYFEAAQIKHITRHQILVMGYVQPANVHLLDTKRCSFVVQDIAGLEALGSLRRPVRVHLELDTGMHRLGLADNELDAYLTVLKCYPSLRLEGVMSHLADADNPKSQSMSTNQTLLFDTAIDRIIQAGFQPEFFHIAQTAGSTKVQSRHANALRLGVSMYGINPLAQTDEHFTDLVDLKPVLRLTSTIIKTYDLKKGDKVSYNGIFTAPLSMRIGILPLGYYEGLPRDLSNRGFITSNKVPLLIVGRICMNHTIINIGETKLAVGDRVTVISHDPTQPNSIQAASLAYDLFAYDWLCGLSSSIKRVIV